MGGGGKGRGKAGKNGNKHKQRDKRVAGFDEIRARNAELEEEQRRKEEEGSEDEEEAESEGEEEEEEQKPKESAAVLKAKGNKVNKDGEVEEAEDVADVLGGFRMKREAPKDDEAPVITRKMKEEMAKEAARKRYEEKHKRGETDEAKADLARELLCYICTVIAKRT